MDGEGSADRSEDTDGTEHLARADLAESADGHPETGSDPIGRAYRYLTSTDVEVVLDAAAGTLGARRVSSDLHRLHHRAGRSVTRVERAQLTVHTIEGAVSSATNLTGASVSAVRGSGRAGAEGSGSGGDEVLVAHAHHRPVPEPVEHIEVPGIRLAVWAYPNDPYLPGLRRAADLAWVTAQLRDVGLPVDGLTLVRRAYRPTRGAVVEARIPSASTPRPVAFLKVLRPDRLHGLVRVHTKLAGSLPVPAVLAHRDQVALLAAVPGTPLRRALRRGQSLPPPDDLVALSALLAASEADTGQDPRRRADPATHAARLRDRVPDHAASLDTIVAAAAHPGETPLMTVHGDLHGGQILTTDGEVSGLLDLDGVGPGHLVDDAANLITYLGAQGDRRPAAADRAARYAAEVLAAYRNVVDPAMLPRAMAGAWLSLAVVAHRAGDEALLRERLGRAIRALDGGTGIGPAGSASG